MAIITSAVALAAAEPPKPLASYSGPSVRGVDTSTLTGKVMAGYQGWFNCEGDGAGLGWTHWARHGSKMLGPGNVTVDLWPAISELAPAERLATGKEPLFTPEHALHVVEISTAARESQETKRHLPLTSAFKWPVVG